MNTVIPLAIITFKEGIRNRALYGISIFALLSLLANFLISGLIMQDVGKVAVDIALSTVSLAGLLVVLFVGINLMSKDLDQKTIYVVLSRPISRAHYIWGKYFGIALLIIFTVVVLGLFCTGSVFFIKLAYPVYTARIAWTSIGLALTFITISLLLLAALSVLFSSFSSSSFVTLVLTIVSYLIGQSLGDIKALLESPQGAGVAVSSVALKVINVTYYMFPNLSLFDLKTQAAHDLAVPIDYVCWVSAYGIVYGAFAITLAALIFGKREFP